MWWERGAGLCGAAGERVAFILAVLGQPGLPTWDTEVSPPCCWPGLRKKPGFCSQGGWFEAEDVGWRLGAPLEEPTKRLPPFWSVGRDW